MPPVREIRIHGVGGATAAELLEDPDPMQERGDRTAGFFRPRRQDASHPKEAYVWGGLTSKALITGFWWLLLPFTLANVSGWMIRRDTTSRRRNAALVVVWISAGVQTVVYVAYIVVIFLDVGSVRCGADAGCVDRWWMTPLTWFEADPVWRVAVGGALVTMAVGLLFGVSARNRRLHETFDPHTDGEEKEPQPPEVAGTLGDRNFWYRPTDVIFRIHLLVATATVGFGIGVALEPAVAESGWPGGRFLAWVLVLAVGAMALIGFLAKPDRYQWDTATASYRSRERYGRSVVLWVAAHLGAVAGAGLAGWLSRANSRLDTAFAEHGFMKIVEWVAYSYVLWIVLLVIFTVQWPARTDVSKSGDVAADDRRIATGFRYLPVPAAVGLGLFMTFSGFSAVLVRLIAYLESGNSSSLGSSLIGGNSSNFAFSAVVALAVAWVLLQRAGNRAALLRNVAHEYFGSEPSESPRRDAWVKRVATTRQFSEGLRIADLPLFVFLLVFAAVIGILNIGGGGAEGASEVLFGWSWLESAGSWVLLLYLFPGVFILRAAIRARDTRRTVGKVWDVLTFWPRIYHPLAAPCYAERAVPELRDRILEESHDGGRVILAAHSQGTVIAYAALKQVEAQRPEALQDVTLVTYGSPIRSLFAPFFPRYVRMDDAQKLSEGLSDWGGWVNFYRETDYIGRWLFAPPATHNSLPPAPGGAADVRLPDPEHAFLPMERHSNYEKEELITGWIDGLT